MTLQRNRLACVILCVGAALLVFTIFQACELIVIPFLSGASVGPVLGLNFVFLLGAGVNTAYLGVMGWVAIILMVRGANLRSSSATVISVDKEQAIHPKPVTKNDLNKPVSEKGVVSTNVVLYAKEKPGMFERGTSGQLILTNQRIIYVKYVWKHWRAQVKNYLNNINEGLKNEGSFVVPLGRVNEATVESTGGTPYLRLRYQTDEGKKTCSFVFSGAKGFIGAFAETIAEFKEKALARRD